MNTEQDTNQNEVANEIVKEMQETTNTSEVSKTPKKNKNIIIFWGIVALIAVVIGAMYILGPKLAAPKPVATNTQQIDPATVRAVVNGEEIKQASLDARLQEAAQVLAAQGIDLTNPAVRAQIEDQVLQDIINYTLLKQGAKEEGTQVEQSVIDSAYEGYITQSGGEEQLVAQLQQIGLTPEEFKQRIQEQLILDAYIAQKVDFSGTEVSDQEVQTFYDNAVAAAGDNAPSLDDVRQQIVEQLTNQKKQDKINAFIDTLRENANIELK